MDLEDIRKRLGVTLPPTTESELWAALKSMDLDDPRYRLYLWRWFCLQSERASN